MPCLGKNTHGENIRKCAEKNTKQAHNQSNNIYVDSKNKDSHIILLSTKIIVIETSN